jgi:hypothetical protein
MKKVTTTLTLADFLFMAFSFISCKSKTKGSDIKAAMEAALKADPLAAGTMVDVKNGVATLSG